MTWVRLDDQFPDHPKVKAVGALGLAMQVAALAYCNRYLTDGFVPSPVVPGLLNLEGLGMRVWTSDEGGFGGGEDARPDLIVEDLIAGGLWKSVTGGYQIHDYLDFQPSKAEVLKEREQAKNRQAKSRSRRDKRVTHGEVREKFECPVPVPKDKDLKTKPTRQATSREDPPDEPDWGLPAMNLTNLTPEDIAAAATGKATP